MPEKKAFLKPVSVLIATLLGSAASTTAMAEASNHLPPNKQTPKELVLTPAEQAEADQLGHHSHSSHSSHASHSSHYSGY